MNLILSGRCGGDGLQYWQQCNWKLHLYMTIWKRKKNNNFINTVSINLLGECTWSWWTHFCNLFKNLEKRKFFKVGILNSYGFVYQNRTEQNSHSCLQFSITPPLITVDSFAKTKTPHKKLLKIIETLSHTATFRNQKRFNHNYC